MSHNVEVIVKNSCKCLDCNKVLVSIHVHDYRVCGCPNQTMVDGGKDYIRRGYMDRAKVEELSEFKEVVEPCTVGYDGKCWRCEMEKRNVQTREA